VLGNPKTGTRNPHLLQENLKSLMDVPGSGLTALPDPALLTS
jgi:hypothetical protein